MNTKPLELPLDIGELSVAGYRQLTFYELKSVFQGSISIYTICNGLMIRGYIVSYQEIRKNNEPVLYIGIRTGNIGEPRLLTIPNTIHCFVYPNDVPHTTRVFERTREGAPLTDDVSATIEKSIHETAKERRILPVQKWFYQKFESNGY